MEKKSNQITFGVSGMGQEEEIDSFNIKKTSQQPQLISQKKQQDHSEEEDPIGLIPAAKQNRNEVQIKSGQFIDDEIDTAEKEDCNYQIDSTKLTSQTIFKDDADQTSNRLLAFMEQQITQNINQGHQIDGVQQMVSELSKISTDILVGRQNLLKKKENDNIITENKPKMSNAERKNKLREIKKQKRKQTYQETPNANLSKTQKEINEGKHNQQFENYYKGLQIVKEDEWDEFFAKMKEPLDVCFRINSIDTHHETTFNFIQNYIQQIEKDPTMAGKQPQKVKWYPNQLAYCFNDVGRLEMRKAQAFKQFHQFLVTETENGRIFRQEKVSMIPVTLLKVESNHKVLDMCAAPGSKTIQIIEYLHQNPLNKLNQGFVIANDIDMKRAYMLTHQARRLNSPSLFITSNDARFFPNLRISENQNNLKFDRILCDVPCSGDGTMRKNVGLWKNFHSHLGHGMHALQLDILERGFKLLKKGGRLVYSTCSFNPLENESVVAAALSRHIKQMKLVDVSKEVSPHLKYRPGFVNWKVFHKGKGKKDPQSWFQSFNEVSELKKKLIKETMFNYTYTEMNNEPERLMNNNLQSDPLNLKYCMRFFPHDDNQGGFFVAVFEKLIDEEDGITFDEDYKMDAWNNPKVRQKEIIDDLDEFVQDLEKSIKIQEKETGIVDDGIDIQYMKSLIQESIEEKKAQQSENISSLNNQIMEKKNIQESQEFPYIKLLEYQPQLWQEIVDFFGIDTQKFPQANLAFQKDTNRNIILLNDGLNELMTFKRKNKLNVVNIGLKLFCKNKGNQECKVDFRILMEGLDTLLPFMDSKRVIKVPRQLFNSFIESNDNQISFEKLKEEYKILDFDNKELGSAVMCFDNFAVTIWIGKNNVSLMVSKEEINSIKFLMKNYQV